MLVKAVSMELKEKQVTEKLSLKPISTYNKTKMISEKVIESYKMK